VEQAVQVVGLVKHMLEYLDAVSKAIGLVFHGEIFRLWLDRSHG